MTNNDELALSRKEFEAIYNETHSVQITPAFKRFGYYTSTTMQKAWELWRQARKPLLAERDADKKRIAEQDKSIAFLKEQLSLFANFNPDWDKLEAAYDSLREHMAALNAAQSRIAELEALIAEQDKRLITYADIATKNASEARTVSVKLPSLNPEMFNDDVMFGYRKAQKEAVEFCAAAGFKLEVGE